MLVVATLRREVARFVLVKKEMFWRNIEIEATVLSRHALLLWFTSEACADAHRRSILRRCSITQALSLVFIQKMSALRTPSVPQHFTVHTVLSNDLHPKGMTWTDTQHLIFILCEKDDDKYIVRCYVWHIPLAAVVAQACIGRGQTNLLAFGYQRRCLLS